MYTIRAYNFETAKEKKFSFKTKMTEALNIKKTFKINTQIFAYVNYLSYLCLRQMGIITN
jgi:hypothetical protein